MAEAKVKRISVAAFVALIAATALGLVIAQRLRHSEPVVIGVRRTATFSPVGSGPRSASLSFWIKRFDQVDVAVVDSKGDFVDTIAAARPVPGRTRVRFYWDGSNDSGKLMADGRYRFRVGLARQGRSLILPQSVRLDSQAARPIVSRITPDHGVGPLVLPGAASVTGVVTGTKGHSLESLVVRTDLDRPRIVVRSAAPKTERTVNWNGRINGGPAPDGVYMLGAAEIDAAGNLGTYPSSLNPLPRAVAGRSGITVRRLAAAGPQLPAEPGATVNIRVDARGKPWTWTLRSAGSTKRLASGRGKGSALKLRLPKKRTGLELLAIGTADRRLVLPIAVNASRRKLLVVMPAIRWQSESPVDQSGDGLLDQLSLGRSVNLGRLDPATPAGLSGLASSTVPLIALLNQLHEPFDLTTDFALASGRGPTLDGRAAVVMAGESTWLPQPTLSRLSAWIKSGGRLLDLGLDGLRSTITVSGATASKPSPPLPADPAGGVRSASSRSAQYVSVWKDQIGLFADTGGRLFAPAGSIGTARVNGPGRLVAAAGFAAGESAVAAWRVGRGLAIHPGINGLQLLAKPDTDSRAFLARAISIIAGGKS